MQIQKQKNNGVEWINIVNPTEEVVPLLQSFHIHPLHIEDALEIKRHSKLERHADYTLIVSRFPIYNPKTREIKAAEVDIFLFANTIITCHTNEIPEINSFFKLCKEESDAADGYFSKGPGFLLYSMLKKIFDRSMPMTDHISADIDAIQARIFRGDGAQLVEQILLVQRNIIDFMRIFKPQISNLLALAQPGNLYVDQRLRPYFQAIAGSVSRVNDILGSLKETIEVMRQTNEALITGRSSKAIKLLTIYSLLTGPLMFFLYQVPWKIPALQHAASNTALFSLVICGLFGTSIGLVLFFRYKRWY